MVVGLLLVALENRIRSSTYITWVMDGAPMPALTPSIFLRVNSSSNILEMTSYMIINR